MQAILSFLTEIFSQPAFLMGLIAFVGLVALRSPATNSLPAH
jgi:PTS system ascorbate-specific IIC component